MKYGLLIHKETKNIGDDIQSYASSLFLPQIDYIVDRDYIGDFKSENNEPVAVIMSAWWMWKKWNWPPASCIVPKLIGMHHMDWNARNWGSPIYDENLDGIGGEYLKAYGPVGCRDYPTLRLFKSHGINSYFSGCITLTLPKMKKRKIKKEYICLVDVNDDIYNKVLPIAQSNDIEIKRMTHNLPETNRFLTWEQRSKNVEKLLTTYQNAKCVITSRLHATLPCLAMEVPVICVIDDLKCTRFDPYKEYCVCISPNQFLNTDIDILNLNENPNKYLKLRNNINKSINEFIEDTKNKKIDELVKIKYTEDEKFKWQYSLMKNTLEKWFLDSRELLTDYNNTVSYCRNLEKINYNQSEELEMIKNSRGWKLLEKIRKIKRKISITVKSIFTNRGSK